MTKRIYTVYLALTAAAVMLCACQRESDMAGQKEPSAQNPAGISEPTDPSSQEDTPAAGIYPTTETKGSERNSESNGTQADTTETGIPKSTRSPDASSSPVCTHATSSQTEHAPQPPSKAQTSGAVSAAGKTTGSGQAVYTATSAATTAAVTSKSPWSYPYDVSSITKACKEETARAGLVWDDCLTQEKSSWNHPHNTGLYTKYPNGYTFGDFVFDGSLKNYIFNEMIPFYIKNQERYSIKRCKIWFEPDAQHPGDYDVYFLYRTDSV